MSSLSDTPPVVEADPVGYLRWHIIRTAEAEDGEYGCVHNWDDMTPECSGYESALEALRALNAITGLATEGGTR